MRPLIAALTAVLMLSLGSCAEPAQYITPRMPVYVEFSPGLWQTYGVFSMGQYQYFILNGNTQVPDGFIWRSNSATGFGGILLIGGFEPTTADANAPLAYDLSCPIENDPTVRVSIYDETLLAVCPECGSTYDVIMLNGAPTSGPAYARKECLRPYTVIHGADGNTLITNK